MKVMIMTMSLMVLGSCAHHSHKGHHGDETAKKCKADMSCCKSGSCDLMTKKKKDCDGGSCDLKKKKS